MKDSEIQQFAKNMQRLREAQNMSQGGIHCATGMDRAYISNLEAGKQNPPLGTIAKLAEACGVPSDQLLK